MKGNAAIANNTIANTIVKATGKLNNPIRNLFIYFILSLSWSFNHLRTLKQKL